MKTFVATLIGLIVCFTIVFLTELLGMKLFPMKIKVGSNDVDTFKTIIDNIPLPALIVVIAGHGLAMFIGLFVSFQIQSKSYVAFLVIFLVMLMGTISNLAMIPHPIWFMIADIGIVLLATLIAWRSFDWK